MSRMKHDVEDDAQSVGEELKDVAAHARDAAVHAVRDVRERANEYVETGRAKAREWEEGLEGYIQEKPIQSLLIAAGVGLALGMLLRRH